MKTIFPLLTRLAALIITIMVAFTACKKQDSVDDTAAKEEFALVSSQTDAEAEVIFDDAFNSVMGVNNEVALGGTGVFGRMNVSATNANDNGRLTGGDSIISCYTVAITQLNVSTRFPLQIVIDFGAGCTGRDGRTRKGKIIIVYTGRLITPGNSATTTFDGYYINGVKVEGTLKVSNTGTQDKKSYTIQVMNGKLSRPNGNFAQWNSEKTITQVDGMNTPLIALDDVFSITGQANGAIQAGDKYFQWSTAITQPLVKRFACKWIVKGTLSLKKGNSGVAELDYGNGMCDNRASFTVNGTVHEITLH